MKINKPLSKYIHKNSVLCRTCVQYVVVIIHQLKVIIQNTDYQDKSKYKLVRS